MTSLLHRTLEHPLVYQLWQGPFAATKMNPILENLSQWPTNSKILDLGSGPGTNSAYFQHFDYLGVDVNPAYCLYARKKYSKEFECADAIQFLKDTDLIFDKVILNSLLHHIDDTGVNQILKGLQSVLTSRGEIYIIELILPKQKGIPYFLAKWDRGKFARAEEDWCQLFSNEFSITEMKRFNVPLFGLCLWNLVFFKLRACED